MRQFVFFSCIAGHTAIHSAVQSTNMSESECDKQANVFNNGRQTNYCRPVHERRSKSG